MSEDGKRFVLGEHEVDVIVHGFPGKSVCHGSLGFSTIALIRHRDRLAFEWARTRARPSRERGDDAPWLRRRRSPSSC